VTVFITVSVDSASNDEISGAAPVMWCCTGYVVQHRLCGAAPVMWCFKLWLDVIVKSFARGLLKYEQFTDKNNT